MTQLKRYINISSDFVISSKDLIVRRNKSKMYFFFYFRLPRKTDNFNNQAY